MYMGKSLVKTLIKIQHISASNDRTVVAPYPAKDAW